MEKVILVFRRPYRTAYSIEYLFYTIFKVIKDDKPVQTFQLPCYGTGAKSLLRNTFSLTRYRKATIHITGDVYYAILGAIFCKRLITIHDLSFLTRTTGMRRRFLKLFWVTLPVRYSHMITVVSTATKEALLREVSVKPEKIRVIYNFIDPIYQPATRIFKKRRPTILQVGADFNKNIDRLAEALKGIDCNLTIIGKLSDHQKEILADCKVRYSNKFSLSLEELHQEYLAADLLSFVSTVEGFGLPVLEAQATGLPVLTSNCSSLPEIAGKGALLVDPFDVKSIRQGILDLMNKDEQRMQLVENGYKNVNRFSKEKIASDYLKVYEELQNANG